MKKILLILLTFISLNVVAQNDYFKIKEGSFTHIEGAVMIDAKEHTDVDDKPMALFKISTENINDEQRHKLVFTTSHRVTEISDKIYKTGQVWIYVTAEHFDHLEIRHPDYGSTKFYPPESLCDFCTYEMVLQYIDPTPVVKGPAKSQNNFLIINVEQQDAAIFIDDNYVGNGSVEVPLQIGKEHTYKIESDLYYTESGKVMMTAGDPIEKNVSLRPAHGFINVNTTPEEGAIVYIDGKKVGTSPYKSDKLASGTYKVKALMTMYNPVEQTVTVTDGNTSQITLNMSANFVNVTVNTDSEADIYIDEEFKAKGKWSGRLSEGMHFFEARKDKHRTQSKNVSLVLGKDETINMGEPEPIYGFLELRSNPTKADIYIDGEYVGQTPRVINDLLIGTHELKLEKQGYSSITKNITIEEGITLTTNETLISGRDISISTDKHGDRVYVNGNYVGLSPLTINLPFGSHNVGIVRNDRTGNKTIEVLQNGGEISYHIVFEEDDNGFKYVDLGLSVKWATYNVGATSPEESGGYYAWGETKPKSTYSKNNSITNGKNINIDGKSQYDVAKAQWGGSWRLPTVKEWQELQDNCTWEWTRQRGKEGCKITGKNGNSIFLPAAGYKYDSSIDKSTGEYWSSTTYKNDNSVAFGIGFLPGFQTIDGYDRYYGRSVRPVTDKKETLIVAEKNIPRYVISGIEWALYDTPGQPHEFKEGISCFYYKGNYGAINKKGDVIIDPIYSYSFEFNNGVAEVVMKEENEIRKCGIIDTKGVQLLPVDNYNYLFEERVPGLFRIKKDGGNYGLFYNKKQILPCEYSHISTYCFPFIETTDFNNNRTCFNILNGEYYDHVYKAGNNVLVAIKDNDFFIFESITGKPINKESFEQNSMGLRFFYDEQLKKYGIMDSNKKILIEPSYFSPNKNCPILWYNDKAIVKNDTTNMASYLLLTKTGDIIFETQNGEGLSYVNDKYFLVHNTNDNNYKKWTYGLFTSDGKIIFKTKFKHITCIYEDFFDIVETNGKQYVYNVKTKKKYFGQAFTHKLTEDMMLQIYVSKTQEFYYVNLENGEVTPKFEGGSAFSDGYAIVKDKTSKNHVINKKGGIVLSDNNKFRLLDETISEGVIGIYDCINHVYGYIYIPFNDK